MDNGGIFAVIFVAFAIGAWFLIFAALGGYDLYAPKRETGASAQNAVSASSGGQTAENNATKLIRSLNYSVVSGELKLDENETMVLRALNRRLAIGDPANGEYVTLSDGSIVPILIALHYLHTSNNYAAMMKKRDLNRKIALRNNAMRMNRTFSGRAGRVGGRAGRF
jgi:hypothetical protein